MEILPQEIISEILSRVTPDSILTCKLVCKAWNALLRSIKVGVLFLVPSDKQLCIYYGDFDELIGDCTTLKTTVKKMSHLPIVGGDPYDYEIVGSCNGLVCLSVPYVKPEPTFRRRSYRRSRLGDPIYICNPVSREYVHLPNVDMKVQEMAGGFGYLRKLNEYKVVRIYYPADDYAGEEGFVQIYTLGDSRGWRQIGEIEHSVDTHYPGVLANETLYYMDTCPNNILALNLATEEFHLLPIPPCLSGCDYQLKVMRGCLCIVHYEIGAKVDIWTFKNNCNSGIWSLDYSMPWFGHPSDFCEPLAFSKSNKLLLWCDKATLCCYDPQTKNLTNIVDYATTFNTTPHINSTVSLKSLGMEESVKEIEEDDPTSEGILPFQK